MLGDEVLDGATFSALEPARSGCTKVRSLAEPPAATPQSVAAQPPAPIAAAPIAAPPILATPAPAPSSVPPILQSYQVLKPPPGAESAQRPDGG